MQCVCSSKKFKYFSLHHLVSFFGSWIITRYKFPLGKAVRIENTRFKMHSSASRAGYCLLRTDLEFG